MKQFFLFFVYLLAHYGLLAQPYQSIFGNNSTEWTIKYENLFGIGTDSFFFQKDTLINSTIHKKISSSAGFYFFKEDTTKGEVTYFSDSDTSKKTVMDLSLSLGDTFYIEGAWLTNPGYYQVDSVYTYSNKKHIRFNLKLSYAGDEKLTFIEGVGSNAGITYQDNPSGRINPYLLCYWNDGVMEHSNIFYQGQCNLATGISDEHKLIVLPNIYPNPALSHITIANPLFPNKSFTVIIYNPMGEICWEQHIQDSPTQIIDIDNFHAGIYFIKIEISKDKIFFMKFIKL